MSLSYTKNFQSPLFYHTDDNSRLHSAGLVQTGFRTDFISVDLSAEDFAIDANAELDSSSPAGKNDGNRSSVFPYIWLRDMCPCPQCFHPETKSRSSFLREHPIDIRPSSVDYDSENDEVKR